MGGRATGARLVGAPLTPSNQVPYPLACPVNAGGFGCDPRKERALCHDPGAQEPDGSLAARAMQAGVDQRVEVRHDPVVDAA
jgi:hypothetical protein